MSTSILMVLVVIEAVERLGVSRDRLLQAVGFDPKKLEDVDARVSVSDYDRFQLAALELSKDEALGLHLGEQLRAAALHLFGYLSDHATTLRQSIETSMKYQAIISECAEPILSEEGEVATLRYAFPHTDAPAIRMASELAMTGHLRRIRTFIGPDAQPRGVFFRYPAPSYAAEYRRVFGGAERFGHTFTGISFERVWLDRTRLHRNSQLYSVLEGQAERTLSRIMGNSSHVERVQEHLTTCDPQQMPSMEKVARHFGMSIRSLRRKLLAEGAQYSDLVRQARTRIAKSMLDNPHATIHETAYAMGFATTTGFYRAFKRWTGMSPT